MKGKPDLRLMARSGVPVAALLLAARRHGPPSVATVESFAVVIAVILSMTGAAICCGWIVCSTLGL